MTLPSGWGTNREGRSEQKQGDQQGGCPFSQGGVTCRGPGMRKVWVWGRVGDEYVEQPLFYAEITLSSRSLNHWRPLREPGKEERMPQTTLGQRSKSS